MLHHHGGLPGDHEHTGRVGLLGNQLLQVRQQGLDVGDLTNGCRLGHRIERESKQHQPTQVDDLRVGIFHDRPAVAVQVLYSLAITESSQSSHRIQLGLRSREAHLLFLGHV